MTHAIAIRLFACTLVALAASGCASIQALSPDERKKAIATSCDRLDPRDRFPGDGCDSNASYSPQASSPEVVSAPIPAPIARSNREASVPFPKTATPSKGSPWRNQHEHGYTGSILEGARLCHLSDREAHLVEEAFSDGAYLESDVPDGAVLDCLTFTRNGVHRAQKSVKVALGEGTVRSRRVRLVELPGNRYFTKFDGCNNLGVVSGVIHQAAAPVCKTEYRVRVWDPSSISNYDGDPTLREDAFSLVGRAYISPALSRSIGERLRRAEQQGYAKKTRCTYRATFSLWDPVEPLNPNSNSMKGRYGDEHVITIRRGEYKIPLASEVLETHAIRIDFPNDFVSPAVGADLKRGIIAWPWEPRDCVVWIHAIAPSEDCLT